MARRRRSRVNVTSPSNRDIKTSLRKADTKSKKKKQSKKSKNLFGSINKDLQKAGTIANKNFDLSPLSRVEGGRPIEVQNALNQHQALSDPFSQAFAGQRSGQLKDYISQLDLYRQGYDAPELNALREARRRELERGFESGRASLLRGQGTAGVPRQARGAQLLELSKAYGRSGADAENDLFIQGAQEKRRANEAYGGAVTQAEADEFTRGQQALTNYTNLLNQARADEFERQKVNLGQEAADRAAQSGAQLGILQLKEARQNAKRQNKIIRQGYKSNERIAGASSGGGGTSQPASNPYAEELAKLAEEYR